jgi:hypothetical protein
MIGISVASYSSATLCSLLKLVNDFIIHSHVNDQVLAEGNEAIHSRSLLRLRWRLTVSTHGNFLKNAHILFVHWLQRRKNHPIKLKKKRSKMYHRQPSSRVRFIILEYSTTRQPRESVGRCACLVSGYFFLLLHRFEDRQGSSSNGAVIAQ